MQTGLFLHLFARSYAGIAPNEVVVIFLLTQEKAINSLTCTVEIFVPNFDALPEMNLYIQPRKEK